MGRFLVLALAAVILSSAASAPAGAAVRYDFDSPGSGSGFAGRFTYLSPDFITTSRLVDAASLTNCNVTFGGQSIGCSSASFIYSASNEFLIFATLGFDFGPNGFNTPGVRSTAFGATLSVTAVPEPMTWAMLVAGFGLVGFAARKSRSPLPISV